MTKAELLTTLDIQDPFKDFVPQKESTLWGWNGDKSVFSDLMVRKKPRLIIEVGSWLGMSTYTMATLLKKHNLDSIIVCVDTWLGSQEHWEDPDMRQHLELKNGFPTFYWSFLSNMRKQEVDDVIVPLPLPSQIAARFLKAKNLQADLIYIDGSHQEQDVYNDLCSYWPLLAPGGVIFGDDWPWESVSNAVKRFCDEKKLVYRVQDINWTIEKLTE